jgi:hypothetical protein
MKRIILIALALISGICSAQTFNVNNLAVAGTSTHTGAATFSIRPTFNGNTPWDSGNFNPANYATLASPNFTGTPAAPTAAAGTNTTQIATTAFVNSASQSPPAINIAYQNTYAPGVRAPLFIWQNPNGSTAAGYNVGQQIWIGNNPTATPGAGDAVASTMAVTNGNNRFNLWAQNLLVGLCGTAEGCSTGDYLNSPVTGQEIDVYGSASWTPTNRAFNATVGTYPIEGQQIYCQGPQYCTTALSAWSTASNGSNWWKEGVALNRVADIGLHFVITPGDTGSSFGIAAIQDDSNSVNVIQVGSGTHTNILSAPNITIKSTGVVIPGSYNVSTLPACNAGLQGGIAYVHDANAPTYNAALTGGGSVAVLAFCTGSAWTAH